MMTATDIPGGTRGPVVLSLGMGKDSAAIFIRWIEEPATRDFDLADLVVITAMTGDEYAETGRLMEDHILPRMREHGVRFVQLARAGKSIATRQGMAGIVVLDDSRSPERLYLDGAYKLSEEWLTGGTFQPMGGAHKCALKQKAYVLDTWLENEFGEAEYRHIMGFNADEPKRVAKDSSYSTLGRSSEYPLVTWGWGRQRLSDYLEETVGEPWAKSCCEGCPFQNPRNGELQERWTRFPEAAARAMWIEHVALCLNPAMLGLFKTRALDIVMDAGIDRAFDIHQAALAAAPHAVYRIRRIWSARKDGKVQAIRAIEAVARGGRDEMEVALRDLASLHGVAVEADDITLRATLRPYEKGTVGVHEVLAVAPAEADDKQVSTFEDRWADALAAQEDAAAA